MRKSWIVIALLAFCLIGATACGGGATQPTTAPQTTNNSGSQPTSVPPTQAKSSESTLAPSVQATNTTASAGGSSSESLALTDRSAGLDKLKSYRINWQSQWSTTESGQVKTSTWDWMEEFSSNPDALHWSWKVTDVTSTTPSASPGSMEVWQIGDTTYMVTPDNSGKTSCISFSSQDASQRLGKGLFSPATLGGVSNARYVGDDNTNGIATKHYTYDQGGITLAGSGKVSGDMWVAVDGGYVAKDVMKWQGSAGLFGLGSSGNGDGQWTWELSNANQPITIKVPDNCGGASADLPIMADAKEKTSFGGTIVYKSPSPLATVVDFYKKQMAAAGWQVQGEPLTSDAMAEFNFGKDGKTVQVTITTEANETSVLINASP